MVWQAHGISNYDIPFMTRAKRSNFMVWQAHGISNYDIPRE